MRGPSEITSPAKRRLPGKVTSPRNIRMSPRSSQQSLPGGESSLNPLLVPSATATDSPKVAADAGAQSANVQPHSLLVQHQLQHQLATHRLPLEHRLDCLQKQQTVMQRRKTVVSQEAKEHAMGKQESFSDFEAKQHAMDDYGLKNFQLSIYSETSPVDEDPPEGCQVGVRTIHKVKIGIENSNRSR